MFQKCPQVVPGTHFAGDFIASRKGITPGFHRGLSLGAGDETRTHDLQHGKMNQAAYRKSLTCQ
jgi:hypothetical protein